MNQERLFDYLENQKPSVLLELLGLAFNEMNISQRHDVFGKIYKRILPDSVDAEQLSADIELFMDNL